MSFLCKHSISIEKRSTETIDKKRKRKEGHFQAWVAYPSNCYLTAFAISGQMQQSLIKGRGAKKLIFFIQFFYEIQKIFFLDGKKLFDVKFEMSKGGLKYIRFFGLLQQTPGPPMMGMTSFSSNFCPSIQIKSTYFPVSTATPRDNPIK